MKFKEAGKSTLAGRRIWFDSTFGRLNTEEKGEYLGSFESDERVLVIYSDGNYELTDTELTQRFDAGKILEIRKFDPEKIITAIYLDNEKLQYNVKRFKIETTTLHNKFLFIKEGEGNRLEAVTLHESPIVLKMWPLWAVIVSRTSRSCRRMASSIAARLRSQRCALPSMSVIANVTVPLGTTWWDWTAAESGIALTRKDFAVRFP